VLLSFNGPPVARHAPIIFHLETPNPARYILKMPHGPNEFASFCLPIVAVGAWSVNEGNGVCVRMDRGE